MGEQFDSVSHQATKSTTTMCSNNFILKIAVWIFTGSALAGRITRSAPNCQTVYDTVWQTVYHEYEQDQCNTRKEQTCHDYEYTQCKKVEKENCEPIERTTCDMDFTVQIDKYVESNCSKSCKEDCEFHWETDTKGDKVWVKDPNTCTVSEQEECEDVEKEKVWKKYFPKPRSISDRVCVAGGEVSCEQVQDQFCVDVEVCDCEVVHKKVPIRVSTKQRKIVCDGEGEDVQDQNAGDISIFDQ